MSSERKDTQQTSSNALSASAFASDAPTVHEKPQVTSVSNQQGSTSKPMIDDSVNMGIDIVQIEKMQRVILRTPSVVNRVFTQDERAYCQKTSQPFVHYATRFAAKQAVMKTLSLNTLSGVDYHDIEICKTSKGRPYAKLRGKAKKVADNLGVLDMPISLSFTHSEAVGCAMAITMDSVSAARKRIDPMRELSQQFKQARLMLDDLPATDAGESHFADESQKTRANQDVQAGHIVQPDQQEGPQQQGQLGGLFEIIPGQQQND